MVGAGGRGASHGLIKTTSEAQAADKVFPPAMLNQ